jgi:predicted dehydrogenase
MDKPMNKLMGKLRVGIVGLGLGRTHTGAYLADPRVGHVVVCDTDPRRIETTRSQFPAVAAGYLTLEEMLEKEKLDAVSVTTPDNLHRPHTLLCLQAGCHVLLAKPLATNLEDGQAIVRATEASGKVLMVAHERRYRASTLKIVELLKSGVLGEIIHLRIDSIQDKREQFRRAPWYASPEAGRTALVGSGIHEVDRLRHLIGRPIVSVAAYSNRLGTMPFPLAKTTSAVYQFEGDAIGQVTICYEAHWPKGKLIDDTFRLVGTKGLVVGKKYTWDGEANWHDLPTELEPVAEGSRGCVAAFLQVLLAGEPNPVPVREAYATLAAAVAADESAASGMKTVPAPEDFK